MPTKNKRVPAYRNSGLPGTDGENGETSEEPGKETQLHIPWKTCRSQVLLLQWIKDPDHYNEYKCGKTFQGGKRGRSRGKTKAAVVNDIVEYFRDNGIDFRTPVMIKNKIKTWEDKWKLAYDYLKSTGEGLTTEDEKMNISTISQHVRKLCPLWDDLHPVFSQRPGMAAVYVGETGDDVDAVSLLEMAKDDASEAADFVDISTGEKEEDYRSYEDMRLEGEVDSDGENATEKRVSRGRKNGRDLAMKKRKAG